MLVVVWSNYYVLFLLDSSTLSGRCLFVRVASQLSLSTNQVKGPLNPEHSREAGL